MYTITIQPTLDSPPEILTTVDTYIMALSVCQVEHPFNYRTHIYDQTDTLLLSLNTQGTPIYHHNILAEEPTL